MLFDPEGGRVRAGHHCLSSDHRPGTDRGDSMNPPQFHRVGHHLGGPKRNLGGGRRVVCFHPLSSAMLVGGRVFNRLFPADEPHPVVQWIPNSLVVWLVAGAVLPRGWPLK